jgi:ribosomal protein S18 acetylase RimI-like enzyme
VRRRFEGYEIDDDRDRVDVAAVHRFLAEESYWARGRSRELVELSLAASARLIGAYDREGRLVGFARVVSDGAAIAYLADVFVLPGHRGRGLGKELVREAVEHPEHRGVRWLLATADAQSLYEPFGFGPPSERLMERPPADR